MTESPNLTSRLAALPAVVLAVLVAMPLFAIAGALFAPSDNAWRHLTATVLDDYIVNSLMLMVLVGVIAGTLGVVTAWLVATCRFPGRRWLSWMLVLPLAAPAYVVAYAYTDLLDVSGPLQSALRDLLGLGIDELAFGGVRSLPSAAIMLSLVLYPYVYLLCRASFANRAGNHFEAARVLGRSSAGAFLSVALPAARPAIAGGLALVLMETLADFGVVQHFSVPTFSTGIYRTWFGLGEQAAAMRLALIMLGFVAVLIAIETLGRRGRPDVEAVGKPLRFELSGWRAFGASAVCTLPVLLGFIVPVGLLVYYKLSGGGDPLSGERFIDFASNSIIVSLAAAIIATALAVLLAHTQRRWPGRLTGAAIRVSTLGYALPGVLLAVGLMGAASGADRAITAWLRDAFGYSGGLVLSGTVFLLVYAYVCRFLTVSYNSVHAGFEALSPTLDAAARSLGATPGGVVRRVHLPLLRPSLVAAALLVFVDAMRELPATLLLRPFNFDTLATRVYWLASDEKLVEASSAALLIVALGIGPALLANRLATSASRGGKGAG
ncbi:MAG: iron ABC transporter permease [Woeseiaceae bacterium]|nr:iron ABC transporter permease [Woeseiaceae bacterium]